MIEPTFMSALKNTWSLLGIIPLLLSTSLLIVVAYVFFGRTSAMQLCEMLVAASEKYMGEIDE